MTRCRCDLSDLRSCRKDSVETGLIGGFPVDDRRNIYRMRQIPAAQWKDGRIEFDVPPDLKTVGAYKISIVSTRLVSKEHDLTVVA